MSSGNFSVLICDDSILARKQLMDSINSCQSDITFLQAANGQECVEMYTKNHPDIVFIDIVMPVLDGVGAVKNIIERDPDATIIIVSSVGTRTELKKAIEAGAKDFIQKPISIDQIKEIINYYINK